VIDMARILKSRLVTCILILTLASTILVFAGDVTVKQGNMVVDGSITVPYVYVLYSLSSYYGSVSAHYVYGEYISAYGITCNKIDYQYSDPAGILYDQKSRQEIIEDIRILIAPDKQGGALVFFNKDTKKLETYVPAEGKFYDLQGVLLYTMPTLQVATEYETTYYLDSLRGEVKAKQEAIYNRYVIKKGFRLDSKTGHFINTATGEIVSKETAIEPK
jgi:hypothetical protein